MSLFPFHPQEGTGSYKEGPENRYEKGACCEQHPPAPVTLVTCLGLPLNPHSPGPLEEGLVVEKKVRDYYLRSSTSPPYSTHGPEGGRTATECPLGSGPWVFCTRGCPSYNYYCLIVCALGHKRLRKRPISVPTREGLQHMRKYIDRVLLAGTTVAALLAFGLQGVTLPPSVAPFL